MKFAVGETAQPAIGPDPELTVLVFAKGANEIIDESLLHRIANDACRSKPHDPLSISPDPHRPTAVSKHITYGYPANGCRKLDRNQCLAHHPEQLAVQCRYEEVPSGVLVDRIDTLGSATRRGNCASGAWAQSEQAALRADPEIVLAIFK